MSNYFDDVQRKALEEKQAAESNKIAQERAAATAAQQKANAARDWIHNVVSPIVDEAHESLAQNGGKATSKSTTANRIDITIHAASKSRNVGYAVGEDGTIQQYFAGRPQTVGKISDPKSGDLVRAGIGQVISDLIKN